MHPRVWQGPRTQRVNNCVSACTASISWHKLTFSGRISSLRARFNAVSSQENWSSSTEGSPTPAVTILRFRQVYGAHPHSKFLKQADIQIIKCTLTVATVLRAQPLFCVTDSPRYPVQHSPSRFVECWTAIPSTSFLVQSIAIRTGSVVVLSRCSACSTLVHYLRVFPFSVQIGGPFLQLFERPLGLLRRLFQVIIIYAPRVCTICLEQSKIGVSKA